MAMEIVDLPIKNSAFPQFFVCLPKGNSGLTNVGAIRRPWRLKTLWIPGPGQP